jgi:hypothetical protein
VLRLLYGVAAFGVVAGVAASLAVATRTSYWPWLAFVWIATLVIGLRCVRASDSRDATVAGLALVVGLVGLPPLLLAPVGWDARSIWFWHATWLYHGGAVYADTFRMPVLALTHVDYPPLSAGIIAAVWRAVSRANDFQLAQSINGLLSWVAIATAGWAASLMVGSRRLAKFVACGFVIAAFSIAGPYAMNGVVDVPVAAWATAAAILLLVIRVEPSESVGPYVILAACALTKNEGTIAAVAIAAIALARSSRAARMAISAAIAPAVFWNLAIASHGARGDLTRDIAHLSISAIPSRIGPIASAYAGRMGVILFVSCLVFVGIAFERRQRALRPVPRSVVVLLGVAALYLAGVTMAYVVSRHDIDWYLRTSDARTLIAPQYLLLAAAVAAVFDPEGKATVVPETVASE